MDTCNDKYLITGPLEIVNDTIDLEDVEIELDETAQRDAKEKPLINQSHLRNITLVGRLDQVKFKNRNNKTLKDTRTIRLKKLNDEKVEPRAISAKTRTLFETHIKHHGESKCPIPSCTFSTTKIYAVVSHYKWCAGDNDSKWHDYVKICRFCGLKIFTYCTVEKKWDGMLEHIHQKHGNNVSEYKTNKKKGKKKYAKRGRPPKKHAKRGRPRKRPLLEADVIKETSKDVYGTSTDIEDNDCDKDSDYQPPVCEEEENIEENENNYQEDDDIEEYQPPTKKAYKKKPKKSKTGRPSKQLIRKTKSAIPVAIKETIEFHSKYYKTRVFEDWLPSLKSWTVVPLGETTLYLPRLKQSMKFRTNGNSWSHLNMFKSIDSSEHTTFFSGGPVSASAWCPIPFKRRNQPQYIAISTSSSMDLTHSMADTNNSYGLIQFWNCGLLELTKTDDTNLEIKLGVAHKWGNILDMEWCPGGTAWQESSFSTSNNDILSRLGLLAIACSDTYVRILSIPHPHLLDNPQSAEFPIYLCEPVVILNPPDPGPASAYSHTVCKCLSWLKTEKQRYIVAGYGSGMVVIWDLGIISPMLIISKSERTTNLRPKLSWMAHGASINCIKWAPLRGAQFLATGGFEREMKIWDLKDLTSPMIIIKKGIITAVDWSFRWCGLFMGFDESYLNFQANVLFKDSGFKNWMPNQLNCHKCCVWAVSCSDWLNTVGSVDNSGEAIVYTNFKFKADTKHGRRRPTERIPLYHIEMKELDNTNGPANDGSKNAKNSKNKSQINFVVDQSKPLKRRYSEMASSYGIVFADSALDALENMRAEDLNRIHVGELMQYQRINDYPILRLTQLKWSPNFDCYTWIFTGSQSGFCRISCVSCLRLESDEQDDGS